MLIYINVDLKFEDINLKLNKKDQEVLKLVQDLKNPILSMKQILMEIEPNTTHQNNNVKPSSNLGNYRSSVSNLSWNGIIKEINGSLFSNGSLKNFSKNYSFIAPDNKYEAILANNLFNKKFIDTIKLLNNEIEEVDFLIEYLNSEFYPKNEKNYVEEPKPTNTEEFLISFKNTHCKLVELGQNKVNFKIAEGFVHTIDIPKCIFKRIINNFIKNSLKRTKEGDITISFESMNYSTLDRFDDYSQKGSNLDNVDKYLAFRVTDNGVGIPVDEIYNIFDYDYSFGAINDENGLMICSKLASISGSRIYYSSSPKLTEFILIYPYNPTPDSQRSVTSVDDFKDEFIFELDFKPNFFSENEHIHVCNCLVIAEDNPNLMRRYTSYCKRRNITHAAFTNGFDCLNYIKIEMYNKCDKCTKITIVTDMHMPYIDGVQLAKEVRAIDYDNRVKLVLLSAEELNIDLKKLFDECCIKPIDLRYLVKLSRELHGFKEIARTTNTVRSMDLSAIAESECDNDNNNNSCTNGYNKIDNSKHLLSNKQKMRAKSENRINRNSSFKNSIFQPKLKGVSCKTEKIEYNSNNSDQKIPYSRSTTPDFFKSYDNNLVNNKSDYKYTPESHMNKYATIQHHYSKDSIYNTDTENEIDDKHEKIYNPYKKKSIDISKSEFIFGYDDQNEGANSQYNQISEFRINTKNSMNQHDLNIELDTTQINFTFENDNNDLLMDYKDYCKIDFDNNDITQNIYKIQKKDTYDQKIQVLSKYNITVEHKIQDSIEDLTYLKYDY